MRLVKALFAGALIIAFMRSPFAALPAAALSDPETGIGQLVSSELSKRYSGARVELTGAIRWLGEAPTKVVSVTLQSEPARGVALFTAQPSGAQGQVAFGAWVPSQIALRRIHPGEKLSSDLFIQQDVNVAAGMAYEYRGLILPVDQEINGLEARQTVMEGQYLLATAVQKVPDVRRGDLVRVRVSSGAVQLSTQGTAIESAYLNGAVRITTVKNKRELSGRLVSPGMVEVQL